MRQTLFWTRCKASLFASRKDFLEFLFLLWFFVSFTIMSASFPASFVASFACTACLVCNIMFTTLIDSYACRRFHTSMIEQPLTRLASLSLILSDSWCGCAQFARHSAGQSWHALNPNPRLLLCFCHAHCPFTAHFHSASYRQTDLCGVIRVYDPSMPLISLEINAFCSPAESSFMSRT